MVMGWVAVKGEKDETDGCLKKLECVLEKWLEVDAKGKLDIGVEV